MNKTTNGWKVGIFVAIALVCIAGLILSFSKGSGLASRYKILLHSENAAGLIPGAKVLMAGVPVGNVKKIEMNEDGKSVTLIVEVLKRYSIHADAAFTPRQSGFIGDQYVAIIPGENKKPVLQDGDLVKLEEPFDISEVLRSSASLLKRIDSTIAQLNTAVARVDRVLLAESTLVDLTNSIGNFRLMSEKALGTLDSVDRFISTNVPTLAAAITNLGTFSTELNGVATDFRLMVSTNGVYVTSAMKNADEAAQHLNRVLENVEKGNGLAGTILRNEALAGNASQVVSNLAVLSSNINSRGIWSTLWQPKQPKTTQTKSVSKN